MSSRKAKISGRVRCEGRVCGDIVPGANVPAGTKGTLYYGDRCKKMCDIVDGELDPESLCATCIKAEQNIQAGKRKIANTTFKGMYGGPVLPGSKIFRNLPASELSRATEAATLAAVSASNAATYSSNAAAAMSGMGGEEAASAKKSAAKAKKAAGVAIQRAKTAAEIEADALVAQLKAARERAAAERAEAAAIQKAAREAEMASKRAAREAEEAAKKAIKEAEKVAKKTETVFKNTTRKARSTAHRSTRKASASPRASGSASPVRGAAAMRSGYATPYSGSPAGSNAYRYNLVKVNRPAAPTSRLNTAEVAAKLPSPKKNMNAAGSSDGFDEQEFF
jgi:hypothetical protein